MGAIAVFGLFKTAQWNNDPNQKKLAAILLEAATYDTTLGTQGKRLDIRELIAFTDNCGWTDKEASNRFVHAVSMIKPLADQETYLEANEIALGLYNSYRTMS